MKTSEVPRTNHLNGSHVPVSIEPVPTTYSLRGVCEAMNAAGIDVEYKQLSTFINLGNIAQQLHVGGGKNGREFPPEAVSVLIAFYPKYLEYLKWGGPKSGAHDLLSKFLNAVPEFDGTMELVTGREVREFGGTTELTPLVAAVTDLVATLRGTATPPPDRLLRSEEAAVLLACKSRSVGRYVRPVRSGVWRESDCLRYIAGLGRRE